MRCQAKQIPHCAIGLINHSVCLRSFEAQGVLHTFKNCTKHFVIRFLIPQTLISTVQALLPVPELENVATTQVLVAWLLQVLVFNSIFLFLFIPKYIHFSVLMYDFKFGFIARDECIYIIFVFP